MSNENWEKLIAKTLEILNSTFQNEPLKEAWCEMFQIVIVHCSFEFIINEVLPNMSAMFALKNQLPIWLWAAKMILSIVRKFGEEGMIKEQKLFKTSKAMCSDLQWKIRLEIAKDLQQIIPKCDS